MSKYITPLELIEETVAYYSEDTSRRGVNAGGDCEYKTGRGQMCAVGRCLMKKTDVGPFNVSLGVVDLFSDYGGATLFQVKYRKIEPNLWVDLQLFHDRPLNWDEQGLTKRGEGVLADIKRNHT